LPIARRRECAKVWRRGQFSGIDRQNARSPDETPELQPTRRAGESAALGIAARFGLAPFHIRSFNPVARRSAHLVGVRDGALILGWYVLVETGSVLWLTVFGALQYLGTLVAPLFACGDRLGHRYSLCACA